MQITKRNAMLTSRLKDALSISGNFVALKMLPDVAGFESIKRPKRKLTLCQHIAQTYYLGRSTMLQSEDMGCYAPGTVLGLRDMPKEVWRRYVGWVAQSDDVARKMFEDIPILERGKYNTAVLMPLQNCPVKPDVVIFAGNAAQMLIIIGAYLHNRGGVLTSKTTGFLSCATVIATPMNEQKPSITIPGNAARLLAFPSESDLLCGIPGTLLEELADNIEFMRAKGAARYPPGWQHISLEPQPPIGDLLKDDGSAFWLR